MRRVWVYEMLSGGGLPLDQADAGELLAQGLAMRDAMVADLLGLDDCAVTVASAPGLPGPPGGARVVAPQPGESAPAFVARQSARHDAVWVVAPETDGLLAALHDAVGATRWLGCSGAAIRVAGSKSATLDALARAGIHTPRAFESSTAARRWVVKPDDGAGALATRIHATQAAARADLAARSRAGERAVCEPWVDGEALSLSLLCSGDRADGRAELLSVNRQQLSVDAAGWLVFEGVAVNVLAPTEPRAAALRATAAQVARAMPGLCGFVGVDLVWHAHLGPVVIEVNPRVTSAYVGLSAALGRNLGRAVLALHDREAVHGDA